MQHINEAMQIHNEWYKEANDITLDNLPEFLNKLLTEYKHDYGTICHALASGAIATLWAMEKSEQGGITGFQSGAIMWEFIKHWNYSGNKTGLKIMDYDNFLYPQYEDKFQKTIKKSIWEIIQKQAKEKLEDADHNHVKYLKDLKQYEIDIKKYIQKYPDYYERQDYYNKLGMGTGEQWDKYDDKVKNGFEFAPSKPYDYCYGNGVYQHWESIIDGMVPFGYRIVKD